MNNQDLFQVGVITTPHGVRGEVKVYPTTDDVKRFSDLEEVIVQVGKEQRVMHVTSVKYIKQMVILALKEISDRNEAELLRQAPILVTRENAVHLEEGEYFIADLIGLTIVDDNGNQLGILTDVIQTGANDVYVCKMENRELLLPAIKECILDTDLESKTMTVHLMKGLLDL
jgi:16S rRNA processing protein RimM